MGRIRLLLILFFLGIFSGAPAADARVKLKKSPAIGKFNNGADFYNFFVAVKVGMSKDQVKQILGKPTKIEGEVWTYFENRAPKHGEVLHEYQIVFLNGKVRKTLIN